MRAILTGALVVALALGLGGEVKATSFEGVTYRCPIGGQKFVSLGPFSTWGWTYRPDGRPVHSYYGWVPLPECPKNGFIMYRDFSRAEINLLKRLIVRPEYKLMRTTESQHYRVAWLEKTLNPQSNMYVWYLLRATWEVDNQPEHKARYRQMFLQIAEAVTPDPEGMEWLWLQLRIANAYREMGDFNKARIVLASLPKNRSGLTFSQAFRPYDPKVEIWSYNGFEPQLKYMQKLLDREDRAVEPIDGLGFDDFTAEECYFREPKTTFETEFCADPKFQAIIADRKDLYEEFVRDERSYGKGPISAPPPPPTRRKPYVKR